MPLARAKFSRSTVTIPRPTAGRLPGGRTDGGIVPVARGVELPPTTAGGTGGGTGGGRTGGRTGGVFPVLDIVGGVTPAPGER